jgi:hypothetical protein
MNPNGMATRNGAGGNRNQDADDRAWGRLSSLGQRLTGAEQSVDRYWRAFFLQDFLLAPLWLAAAREWRELTQQVNALANTAPTAGKASFEDTVPRYVQRLAGVRDRLERAGCAQAIKSAVSFGAIGAWIGLLLGSCLYGIGAQATAIATLNCGYLTHILAFVVLFVSLLWRMRSLPAQSIKAGGAGVALADE